MPRLAASPEPVLRHSLVPNRTGCTAPWLHGAYADRSESGGRLPPPLLWNKLDQLQDGGWCYRLDRVRDARADFVMAETYNFRPDRKVRRFDWRLHPIEPFHRWEIYRREPGGLRRIMRRTNVAYSLLSAPLAWMPPIALDMPEPGRWMRAGERRLGREPVYVTTGWRPWITNDLRLTGL